MIIDPHNANAKHQSTALVAQLVARRSDKAKVIGSSPVESTYISYFFLTQI